jgi:hypothetical protein
MRKEMTWREAIDIVLKDALEPMYYRDIADRIVTEKLRTNVGATPAATVNAQISAAIKKEGANAPYIRVARGMFSMAVKPSRGKSRGNTRAVGNLIVDEDLESQYDIITSFGIFWRRESVYWRSGVTGLLGMQQRGATEVDFGGQLGIYLLYDGREVIYIGRATDRPLGKRLYEHTQDRLAARWNRFSWFGLLPVAESGALGKMPKNYDATKIIPALEAILIEATEPRQNRKRGDDLAAVEYVQHEAPEVAKNKLKAAIEQM